MKIKTYKTLTLILLLIVWLPSTANREVKTLTNWKFSKGDFEKTESHDFDDSSWEQVQVPHDWAIAGPFDKEVDKQVFKIVQNNEKVKSEKTGRTGSLPFIGSAWYRTNFETGNLKNKQIILSFDGAMSHANVYVNGKKVGSRAYGYVYFYFDITTYLKENGNNLIAVRLENKGLSSRWYPGAGLFRKVQVTTKNSVSFKHWGQFISTPYVDSSLAKVNIKSKVQGTDIEVRVKILDAQQSVISESSSNQCFGDEVEQIIPITKPQLWGIDHPYLYTAQIELWQAGKLMDKEEQKFGIRSIKYSPEKGFELNGKQTKFKGVCLHHDLGPLGAAVNKDALRRQLEILKDMGCNAIRSAHNMPSIEQVELCDEMGILFLAESFDEWKKAKVPNGYNKSFDQWVEQDIVNLVHATRNHPSIVMWSAGNEVPDQWGSDGVKRAKWIQEVFHREDPTRPVTVGMDQVKAVMQSGFASVLDIPGLNYRVHLYEEAFKKFPQGFLLGSETASTVSSRGIYKFPVVQAPDKKYKDGHCSSYDLEYCNWSNIPEVDFQMQDDKDWVIGEFVWTGFDYLGEPTPYDNFWPSRSSYFGICDLAGLPKDRFYLYRSRWNTTEETLHILPHWNWEGKEGDTIPVFVYTNYNSAELFINGKSQGKRSKNKEALVDRYRLRWMNTQYQPGEIKVIAFDDNGKSVAEKIIKTAGKPYAIKLESNKSNLKSDSYDNLAYITATIVDKNGNVCPNANNQLEVKVSGAAQFKAICNGDQTSLELFTQPTMKAFSGKLVLTINSIPNKNGLINIQVSAKGLKTGELKLMSK
jgi:beta-galactosidase